MNLETESFIVGRVLEGRWQIWIQRQKPGSFIGEGRQNIDLS